MTLMMTFVFLTQGWSKFSSTSGWARAFAHWGYPVWFRVLIGVVEVSAAILVLWPRSAPFGAAMIICVMLGGMGTHIFKDAHPRITSELLHLIFATTVLVARLRARRARVKGRETADD